MVTATEIAQEIIVKRYENLEAAHTNPLACFVCGRVVRLYTALVKGPNTTDVGGPMAWRGHGVCRTCIRNGEARRA